MPAASSPQPIGTVEEPKTQERPVYVAMSAETEELFKKWLKVQVTSFYLGGVMRFLIFVLIVASTIYSINAFAPFIKKQLETLSTLEKSLGISGGDKRLEGESQVPQAQMVEALQSLTPEEKEMLINEFLERSRE